MRLSKKLIIPLLIAFALFTGLGATVASAHVTVKPNMVGVANRETFTVNVPTEKTVPTTQVRLLVPENLQSITPHVKAGWDIELVKNSATDPDKITEVIWSGGSIPADQMGVFAFNAQAPIAEGELVWKAYQTYADGEVVAWDASPGMIDEYVQHIGEESDEAPKPYSTTEVIDDLSTGDGHGAATVDNSAPEKTSNDKTTLWIALIIALALSGYWMKPLVSLFKKQKSKK